MQIKIGVMGTQPLVEKLMTVIKGFPTLVPIVRMIEKDDEAPHHAEQLAEEVEVPLLFGELSYRRVKDKTHLSIPVVHVPLTGAGLYKSLFLALRAGKLDGGDISRYADQINGHANAEGSRNRTYSCFNL